MIRSATVEDLPALLELEADAFVTDRISRRSFRHLLTRANAASLVDADEAGLCGYVTVLFNRRTPLARLYSLAVQPRCRGRRKADELLEAAERASCRHGCSVMRLEVHPGNAVARRLYERRGFHEIGIYRKFYEDGADAIRMEKQLTATLSQTSPAN